MNLNVTTDKEKLVIENKTHIINRETYKQFVTNKIDHFKKYIDDICLDGTSIYYNEKQIQLYLTSAADLTCSQHAIPSAVCKLEYSDEMKMLQSTVNKRIGENEFLSFLRKFIPYGKDIHILVDSIENMTMKKVVSMSRSKDSRGNYAYEYSMKDAEKATFIPPKKIKISIPVLKYLAKDVTFEFDFSFQYNITGVDEGKQVNISYALEMFNFDQLVENSSVMLIELFLEKINVMKYWGALEFHTETDAWKYQDVPMKFEGVV